MTDVYDIVALPEGTGPIEARYGAKGRRDALAKFAELRGIVGRIEDDDDWGVVLNGDRIVYAAKLVEDSTLIATPVCECCERVPKVGEHGWRVDGEGNDFCPDCGESLVGASVDSAPTTEITVEMIERALDQEYGPQGRWRGTRIEDLARQRMRAVLDAALNGRGTLPKGLGK